MTFNELYGNCALCPRKCGVDRTAGEKGYCRAGTEAEIALTMLHRWEEPCISGIDPERGSGAIFFVRCTLGCVYCQNYAISRPDRTPTGKERTADADGLAGIMLELQERGAYNINLVTPTHFMPVIAEGVLTTTALPPGPRCARCSGSRVRALLSMRTVCCGVG